MHFLISIAFALYLFGLPATAFAELFRWTDEKGQTHVTDRISKVPREYRKQLSRIVEMEEKDILPILPKHLKHLHPEKGQGLAWPIQCVPGKTCSIGFPDVDKDGASRYGRKPGYKGHDGTDIGITWKQMDRGVNVYAAADGIVKFVFDDPNRFDRCTSKALHPDCKWPEGTDVDTGLGPYCHTGGAEKGQCHWGFGGGNVVVILHPKLKMYSVPATIILKAGPLRSNPDRKSAKDSSWDW